MIQILTTLPIKSNMLFETSMHEYDKTILQNSITAKFIKFWSKRFSMHVKRHSVP